MASVQITTRQLVHVYIYIYILFESVPRVYKPGDFYSEDFSLILSIPLSLSLSAVGRCASGPTSAVVYHTSLLISASSGKSSPYLHVWRQRTLDGGLEYRWSEEREVLEWRVGQTSVNYGGRKTFTALPKRKASLFFFFPFFRHGTRWHTHTHTHIRLAYIVSYIPFPGES